MFELPRPGRNTTKGSHPVIAPWWDHQNLSTNEGPLTNTTATSGCLWSHLKIIQQVNIKFVEILCRRGAQRKYLWKTTTPSAAFSIQIDHYGLVCEGLVALYDFGRHLPQNKPQRSSNWTSISPSKTCRLKMICSLYSSSETPRQLSWPDTTCIDEEQKIREIQAPPPLNMAWSKAFLDQAWSLAVGPFLWGWGGLAVIDPEAVHQNLLDPGGYVSWIMTVVVMATPVRSITIIASSIATTITITIIVIIMMTIIITLIIIMIIINQSTNQPINQSINQSTNQSITFTYSSYRYSKQNKDVYMLCIYIYIHICIS